MVAARWAFRWIAPDADEGKVMKDATLMQTGKNVPGEDAAMVSYNSYCDNEE